MKKLVQAIAAIGLAGGVVAGAQAAMINGSVSFIGFNQAAICSGACSTATWTGIDFPAASPNAIAGAVTGDLAVLDGAFLTMSDLLFANLPTTIWSVGGFTFQGGTINHKDYQNNTSYDVTIVGTLSGNGYEATPGQWIFTGNTAGNTTASWSASQAQVPVPGTIALLGLGLVAAGLVRRRG